MLMMSEGTAYRALIKQIGMLISQRIEEGETFRSIAQAAGLKDQMVVSSYYYGSVRSVQPSHLDALCRYLGVDVTIVKSVKSVKPDAYVHDDHQ